jgi:hypothetical protein
MAPHLQCYLDHMADLPDVRPKVAPTLLIQRGCLPPWGGLSSSPLRQRAG